MRHVIHLILLAMVSAAGTTYGQQVTGNLEGRVLNGQGEVLAGVNIVVRGTSLQGVRGVTSDAQGYFRVVALPVGYYTAKISHMAYQGVTYENVSIRLGKTTTLGEVRLNSHTVEMPEVVVNGERPLIDLTSTTAGTNLASSTFETLPVDRNFRSMVSVAPQANTSYFGDEVNISGSTGPENAYFIDGVNVTDPQDFSRSIVPEIGGLEGQYFDEFTLGYERALGDGLKLEVRGVYRTLRQGIESAIILEGGEEGYIFGNPGKGDLSFLPRLKRRYTALELTLERSVHNRSHVLAAYVLSRNYGNESGLYKAETGEDIPHLSSLYSRQQISPNQTGLLPNDRTHVFKFFGSYRFEHGLTAGTSLFWQRGTPLSEYVNSSIGEGHVFFLAPRGSAGRTPAIWDWNARLACDLAMPSGTSLKPRLILDVFHLFSRREAVILDQLHYVRQDQNGNPTGLNPNYRTPTRYQPPMTARLGMEVDF